AGGNDAFLVSISASGSAFNYSTYLGGTGNEDGMPTGGIPGFNYAVANSPFVNNRPTAFVDPVSTPLGNDFTIGLTVDSQGNAYAAGGTTSIDFPVTPNALQPGNAGGTDGFIVKFDPKGNQVYGTYLGGAGDDACRGVALDANGDAVVAGWTTSTD